jgi:hypothetical protein
MPITMKDSYDTAKLLDEVLMNKEQLWGTEIALVTLGGVLVGQLESRTEKFAILKGATERKANTGDHKGKSIYRMHYVAISSIVAMSFDSVG